MATVTHGVTLDVTTAAGTYTTGSFTPAADDLLVAFPSFTGGSAADTWIIEDSLGGSWTQIATEFHYRAIWVRDALVSGAAMTVTFRRTAGTTDPTGAFIFVARVAGMTKTGSAAARQFHNSTGHAAAGTPSFAFGAACLAGNPVIVRMQNSTNPAGVTPPAGFTERADVGYGTPASGGEYASIDSGFTDATVTWGSTSASAGWSHGIELDASAAAGGAPRFMASYRRRRAA